MRHLITTLGFAGLAVAMSGCIIVDDHNNDFEEIQVGCWAIGVTDFSSTGIPGSNDFAPTQATGIPDTQDWSNPTCVDSELAWSPEYENAGAEYIDLIYAAGLRVDRVRIFENFGAGASDQVTLINTANGNVPSASILVPTNLQGPGQPCSALVLDIDSENGGEYTVEYYDKVALDLNTALSPGFNEIDAVQLVGLFRTDIGPLPGSCDTL